MRRLLASILAAVLCLTVAPAFAGVPPLDPLTILIGSTVVVPLVGSTTVFGQVSNPNMTDVFVDGGAILNDGNGVFAFGFLSFNSSEGEVGANHALFTVSLTGAAPQMLPGLQFQAFSGGVPFGTSNAFTVQTAAPGPETLMLLGTGLAGLGGLAWRRHRRR